MNLLREFLHALVLRSLHESEAFTKLALVGGTALRFVHGMPRFSEALDFSLEQPDGYEPERWMRKVKRDLELAGLDVSITWNAKSTVHKAWLKWEGVLREAGLSPRAGQKLAIKVEIDTRPPTGAICERRVVTRHRLLALNLHNLPSLMAGKVHAIVTRSYPKGRDWYDLLWYLGRRPVVEPNPVQLQNALDQTQGIGGLNAADWRSLALDRLRRIDAAQLAADAAPFLEHRDDGSMLTAENLSTALR
jgi:predicted nucleotidyltransferase component of viral defense system